MSFDNIFDDDPPPTKKKDVSVTPLVEELEEKWVLPEILKKDGVVAQGETPEKVEVFHTPGLFVFRMRLTKVERDVAGEWVTQWKSGEGHEFEFPLPFTPKEMERLNYLKTSRPLDLMVGSYFDMTVSMNSDGVLYLRELKEIN